MPVEKLSTGFQQLLASVIFDFKDNVEMELSTPNISAYKDITVDNYNLYIQLFRTLNYVTRPFIKSLPQEILEPTLKAE